jgi:HlyD family secretion protein
MKKKIILVVILVGGLGAGTYYWKNGGEAAEGPEITLVKIERGSLKQIVATTGKVVSNLDVDIKCKASGTVKTLPYDISDAVTERDVIVEIDPVDMNRIVAQSEVSLRASQARLATARQNLVVAERNLATDRDRAETALRSAEVAAADARAKADRMKQLFEKKLASQEECDTAETSATQAQGSLEGCKIKLEELKTQEQALEVQRQSVILAEGQVESDRISLDIAKAAAADCTVRAPMDGVVTDRKVQTGTIIASGVSNVGGGTTILTLSDLSHIFVLASVDESDIGKVAVGQEATITVDAYPSTQFAGKVVRIASKGQNTQNVVTFEVKIEVLGAYKPLVSASQPSSQPGASAERDRRNREGRDGSDGAQTQPGPRRSREPIARGELLPEKKNLLKPEMTANIEITTAEREDALLLPAMAVSRQGGQMYANVPAADPEQEEFDRKPVALGIDDGETYELLAGMGEGDTVVISGEVEGRWSSGPRRGGMRGAGGAMRVMRMGSRR